ncbi:MAG TPA: hypothetical protein VHG08_09360 [Longimicrobium sp.]|nr:hypothetical protein [Longimicrobium sp.]
MSRAEPAVFTFPQMRNLSKEERKSVTHSEFWIPEAEREVYKRALNALNAAGVPCVVAGAYAIYEHTKIIRQTKDLDLFCTPEAVLQAMRVLREAGFITRLEQSHWLAKAISRDNRDHFVDIIYGMGNGLALIDEDWFRHSSPAILAATQVRVAPPEELIWHRLFINERHRHDMADIAHLILCVGHLMDWRRLIDKTGEHWPLLLSQVLMFRYVYPGYRDQVPQWVIRELLSRAEAAGREHSAEGDEHDLTRGTLISRFSFAIDVNEWGFHDLREEKIREMQGHPAVVALEQADVWDEQSDHATASSVPDTLEAEE